MPYALLSLLAPAILGTVVVVRDENGKPVEKASIFIYTDSFPTTAIHDPRNPPQTGSNGTFDLKKLNPPSLTLLVIVTFEDQTDKKTLSFEDGKFQPELTLRLRPRDANRGSPLLPEPPPQSNSTISLPAEICASSR